MLKSDVFLTQIWTQLLLYLSAQPDCVKVLEKIIARTLCFIYQIIFRLNYVFNIDAYFLDFHAQKFILIFLNLNPFNINKPCFWGSKLRKTT